MTFDPGCIYSITTTTSQSKGATTPPPPAPWALPYKDDFQSYELGKRHPNISVTSMARLRWLQRAAVAGENVFVRLLRRSRSSGMATLIRAPLSAIVHGKTIGSAAMSCWNSLVMPTLLEESRRPDQMNKIYGYHPCASYRQRALVAFLFAGVMTRTIKMPDKETELALRVTWR